MKQAALNRDAPRELTFALLRLLADGEFHSGETLARRCEVSRASVHNALRGIEDYGLTLYSVRGRGYRLAQLEAGAFARGPPQADHALRQRHVGHELIVGVLGP